MTTLEALNSGKKIEINSGLNFQAVIYKNPRNEEKCVYKIDMEDMEFVNKVKHITFEEAQSVVRDFGKKGFKIIAG